MTSGAPASPPDCPVTARRRARKAAILGACGLSALGLAPTVTADPVVTPTAPGPEAAQLASRMPAPKVTAERRSGVETVYAMPDGTLFTLRRVKGGGWLTAQGSEVSRYLFESVGGRGDLIFRDAGGRVVLRFTDFGAGTFFTEADPTGVPVEQVKSAPDPEIAAPAPR